MVVTPPAAAAWPAERKDSRCRAPGSPTKTRMSTNPGASALPPQSITSPVVPGAAPSTTSSMMPSRTRSAPRRSPFSGSIRRALMKVSMGSPRQKLAPRRERGRFHPSRGLLHTGEQLHAGHADGDAHLDLIADHAVLEIIRHLRIDLDAPVHRPWMHDDGVRLRPRQLFARQPVKVEIFAGRGNDGTGETLVL